MYTLTGDYPQGVTLADVGKTHGRPQVAVRVPGAHDARRPAPDRPAAAGRRVDKFLTFTIVGLSIAAIYAVIASGLVLTYTTTGIFNFAHGAAGHARRVRCTGSCRFDWGWPVPLVADRGPRASPRRCFGVLLEVVVMRGLRGTTETVKLVVSISLLLFMIGLAQLIWAPGVSRPMAKFFQRARRSTSAPRRSPGTRRSRSASRSSVAIGLRLVLTRSRFGIAMRAAVDDRSLSALNGARPEPGRRCSPGRSGTALAALGGILIAPNVALDAPSLSLLIVSAYAAAIFGRLRSLPLTFVGAIVVGLTEGYLDRLPARRTSTCRVCASRVPAILLFLVLLVLPNPRLRGRMTPQPRVLPDADACAAR